MPNKCLPDHLKGKRHDDWKFLFGIASWVPRSWTAWCGWAWPQPPKRLLGNSGWTEEDWYRFGHFITEDHSARDFLREHGHVLPIPKSGYWILSAVFWLKFIPLPMFAKTFRNGDYFSLGIARWDDVDKYYDLMRIRAHGLKGKIALGVIFLLIVGVVYFASR